MTGAKKTAPHYREKAEDIRAKAAQMNDRGMRELMLGIAADYDHMAETVESIDNASDRLDRRNKRD